MNKTLVPSNCLSRLRTSSLSVSAIVMMTMITARLCTTARAELIGYWNMNDFEDTATALDLSGKENHGDITSFNDAFGTFDWDNVPEYTADGGGFTGQAGDRALDFGLAGDGAIVNLPTAADGAFDSIVDNDAFTISLWALGGDDMPANNDVFGFYHDPDEFDGDHRMISSHLPWGSGIIFLDTAGCCGPENRLQMAEPDETLWKGQWNHYAFVKDLDRTAIYQNGELWAEGFDKIEMNPIVTAMFGGGRRGGNPLQGDLSYGGLLDDFAIWDEALPEEEIALYASGESPLVPNAPPRLQAGDADQDLDFDQLDLVQVQIAAKYLTGQPATWGEGDWDGAPGGGPGDPPVGDGVFSQLDIISALGAAKYLTGPYAAVVADGRANDDQTSLGYNPSTGEVWVDAPSGTDLTSINIDSAAGIFTGDAAQNLGGSFDNDADNNIFKATFGSSFGTLSFGNVAQTGLAQPFVLADLTVVGSLAGGGDLGNVDLIYVPEPSTWLLLVVGLVLAFRRCQCFVTADLLVDRDPSQ